MNCYQCPWVAHDKSKECTFPDCQGGWHNAYRNEQGRFVQVIAFAISLGKNGVNPVEFLELFLAGETGEIARRWPGFRPRTSA